MSDNNKFRMNKKVVKIVAILSLCFVQLVAAKESQTIKIVYITQQQKVPPALSNLDEFIQNKGLQGAEMAIEDNNTTGQFTGQHFELQKIIVPASADVAQVFAQHALDESDFVVSNLLTEQLKTVVAIDKATDKLFFDASTTDDDLRSQYCDNNIFHMLPSRAMRADALAQYKKKKRWNKWFLVTGMTEADRHYAQAIKRAAKRFGIKVVAEKAWTHTYDARRTAQSDVPVFTQGLDYDVLVVADEQGLFGEYFDYRTWIPRPVAGTQGLVPTSWHKTHEQWGAVQIQNRFKRLAGRWMDEQDYGAYLAVRAIGEAVVRTHSKQMKVIKDYLLGDAFALQGYKGKPLTFRSWNGQLRQPVLLAAARSMVAVAPIDGFLHPTSELDTLGFDKSESACVQPASLKEHAKVITKTDNSGQPSRLDKLIQALKNKIKELKGEK